MILASFDRTNPMAVRHALKHSATLITDINKATRAGIRQIIAEAFTEGRPPRETAKLIRAMIGLTEQGAGAVARLRAEMAEDGASREKIDKAAERYTRELIADRADMIAQTESLNSARAGQVELWNQAREAGLLSGQEMMEWIFTDDEVSCDICEFLAGQKVPIGENFVTEDGTEIEPGDGAHPRCRCSVGLVEAQL